MITFEQICQFIDDRKISFDGELSLNTCINDDLLIVGDDADEFLQEFSKQFKVNFSDFIFSDYFPDEATANMHYYLLTMKNKKSHNRLMMLVRSIEIKFWGMFANKKNYKPLTLKKLLEIAM